MKDVTKFFVLTNNLKMFYANLYLELPEEAEEPLIRSLNDLPSAISSWESDVFSDLDSDESIEISYNLALRRSQTILDTVDSLELSFDSLPESSNILDRIRETVSEEVDTDEIEDSSDSSFNPFKEKEE
ncbi:hypothetical protein [Francisella sp. SYW-2]|uniref:hypothetical protein n=1 Tax=Francisella sp. SYW-2 TaxID=2610886 RepID=UPI00123DE255|nr:hypothetical protein [Francisella sp. SYW-2]